MATVVDRCFPLPLFQDNLLFRIIRHFSLNRNLKHLLETKPGNANRVECIDGIRFLAMCWLIYGHAYFVPIKETFKSSLFFIDSVYDAKMHLIYNAWIVVDVFFIFSATLLSFHCFRVLATKSHLNVIKLIANRVARLWPAVWLIIGVALLVPKLAQGPLWPEIIDREVRTCVDTWWRIPLFIANLNPKPNICLIQTWYISADFQLFLLCFAFIFLIFK